MNVFFIKKKFLLACVAVTACVLGVVSAPKISTMVTSNMKSDLPIYNVQTDEKVVSLSFDAAWGNEDTQQLIDILGSYNIKATFFVVGEWVDKYPESVLALHQAGHQIQNHSDTHPNMPTLSYEKMVAEINNCADKVEAITGVRPTLFRPPYGDYNDNLVGTLREQGHYCIQWDVDIVGRCTPEGFGYKIVKKSSSCV